MFLCGCNADTMRWAFFSPSSSVRTRWKVAFFRSAAETQPSKRPCTSRRSKTFYSDTFLQLTTSECPCCFFEHLPEFAFLLKTKWWSGTCLWNIFPQSGPKIRDFLGWRCTWTHCVYTCTPRVCILNFANSALTDPTVSSQYIQGTDMATSGLFICV